MTTRPFWLLVGIAGIFILAGLWSLNATLIALAAPLLVYLAFAVYLAPGVPDLEAQRVLSTDRITEETDLAVRILLENRSGRFDELHLSEAGPLQFKKQEGDVSLVLALQPGQQVEYAYTVNGWRGAYRFNGLLARASDPFGLFESRNTLNAGGNVLVYPKVTRLNPIPIRPPQTIGFYGPIASGKVGSGTDFFGVRQYQLGDSLRRINWRTSARHSSDLFTNVYEQERIANVGVILDGRPHNEISFDGRSLFEYSVHAAASISEMFISAGHCLSMLIYSSNVSRVFPGYGKVQFERVMKALAHAETGLNYVLEDMRNFPVRMLPPRGQLVYVSPLDAGDLMPLVRFRALGYAVMVVSPDPLFYEFQSARDPSSERMQLARRFAQIERDLLVQQLRQAGVQVLNWRVDQDLSDAIDRVRPQLLFHRRETVRALR